MVDSGIDPAEVLRRIGRLGAGLDFLVNTHCHYDHIGGDLQVMDSFNPRVCVHELDALFMESGDGGVILSDWFGGRLSGVKVDVRLVDGQVIDLGGIKLEVIHTPGHTQGSICLYEPESKSLFSGDTVFSDGVGRTDLPGGSWEDLRKSLERLLELHKRSGIDQIYPGHGPVGVGADIERIYLSYFR